MSVEAIKIERKNVKHVQVRQGSTGYIVLEIDAESWTFIVNDEGWIVPDNRTSG